MSARTLFALAAFSLSNAALAHDVAENQPKALGLEETLSAFNINTDDVVITTEEIADGLHVLFDSSGMGNVVVSTGADGILIVDDQIPQLVPKIQAAINDIAEHESDVDIIVNTHWHWDHAEGNLAFGKGDVQIVAQKNSREMMLRENIIDLVGFRYKQQAYEAHGLPTVTFEKAMSFYFNDEEVALFHFGPAHTTGDTAVYFRNKNAVHMGDVFNNSGFPFIDADNGGSIDGVIAFCEAVLAEINEDTVVIPGHGPVTDYTKFSRYIEMLKQTRSNIKERIDRGDSLDDILDAKPTAQFDEEFAANGSSITRYVDRVYTSLTR